MFQDNPSLFLRKLEDRIEGNIKDNISLLLNYFKILDYMLVFETLVYDEEPKLYSRHSEVRACALNQLRNLIRDREVLSALGNVKCTLDNVAEKAREAWDIVSESKFEDNVGDKELTLYVVEVAGIQKYVYSSGGALIDVQGGSIHVDSACWLIGEEIRKVYGEEALVQAAAGEIVALIPKKVAGEVIGEVEEYVKNNLVFRNLPLKSNANSKLKITLKDVYDVNTGVFGKLYKAALNEAEHILKDSEGLIEEARVSEVCEICHSERGYGKKYWGEQIRKLGVFRGEKELNEFLDFAFRSMGEEEVGIICEKCLFKRLYSYLYRKIWSKKELLETGKKLGLMGSSAYKLSDIVNQETESERIGVERYPVTLDNYNYDNERNALIMLVHGDGDGFGTRKTKAKTVGEFRLLSKIYYESIKNGLRKGFSETIKNHYDITVNKEADSNLRPYYYPILPVYFGGDDFVVIGRAENIVTFLQGFSEGLREAYETFKDIVKSYRISALTVSIGISVGKTKTPIFMLYEGSERIVRNVKAVSRNLPMRLGVKSNFVYFRGDFSRKYLEDIVKYTSNLGSPAIMFIGDYRSQVDYVELLKKIIGCTSNCNRSSPVVSVSDLVEYVEEGYEYFLGGDWLVLKLTYDAARLKEADEEKSDVLKKLAEKIASINSDYSWVIILKLTDLYDILRDYVENMFGKKVLLKKLCNLLGVRCDSA